MIDGLAKYRDYIIYDDDLIGHEDLVKKMLYYYHLGYQKAQKYGYCKTFVDLLEKVKTDESEALLNGYKDNLA